MNTLPQAQSVPVGEDKARIAAQARRKFSAALANDTQWNELLAFVRAMPDWRPPYRSKWVNGHVSEWDSEWCYHLPCPFVGVEWFDMWLIEVKHSAYGQATVWTDHGPAIAQRLRGIGFDFEIRGDVARIWGYYPRSCEDLPPAQPIPRYLRAR
ncbi:MAG: hypothetical protein Q4A28_07820 [Brachymonas sp.]|nr:hypothetical protein [Brachymonas sp.]